MTPGAATEVTASRNFNAWLAEQRVSLAVSTYQTGKLLLIGLQPDGQLAASERVFNRCMGLWSDGQAIWLSTLFQLWRLENLLQPGQLAGGHDRLYVPLVGFTTGDVDVHDIAVDAKGRVVFVNTLFNCLATPSGQHSFAPLWLPPFISRLTPEDRCHLNGLALEDGTARYVTAVSASDVTDGWRDRRQDGGCLLDVARNQVVLDGLSMPHSPRVRGGELWLHNSGTGFFGRLDAARAAFEPVVFCPGYLRGLAFLGDYAVVGLSRPRHDKTFFGLALDENLRARGTEARCGLQVIDLRSGVVVHWLRLEGVDELFDVVVLPGVVRPAALGFTTDEICRTFSVAPTQVI